jgi:hypothetical protein
VYSLKDSNNRLAPFAPGAFERKGAKVPRRKEKPDVEKTRGLSHGFCDRIDDSRLMGGDFRSGGSWACPIRIVFFPSQIINHQSTVPPVFESTNQHP